MRTSRKPVTFAAALALAAGLAACSPAPSSTAPTPSMTDEQMSTDGHGTMPATPSGDPFADARVAAAHMPPTAATLAGGFVEALGLAGQVDSPAADLRAGLTALLQEHVYLAGIAVATAYTVGADAPETAAALEALDANGVDLADAVGSLAGEENRDRFLASWRDHIGFFVDYAVAVKSGDDDGARTAQEALTGYAGAAGRFFEEVSGGELPAAAVTEHLQGHIDTLSDAIDALAAGDPTAFDKLQASAAHVVDGASVLATGLATATGTEGDPNDEASGLRSGLTALLQEHVYLAGIAVFTAYTSEGSVESPAFAAAAAELDENSVTLANAVGSLAGEEQGEAFLGLWREHIGFFVDYAVGRATGDDAKAQAAIDALNGYRGTAGAFFEGISGGELPANAIAEGLAVHVGTLAQAIDSMAAALVPQS